MTNTFVRFKEFSKRNFHWSAIVVSICFLVGAYFRIRQFAAGRSLWLDEAMLALNIVNRSWVGLAQPLDYNQGAPLGFLFVQKLIITLFGNTDFNLRLFPLIAGILSFFLIWKVSRFFLSRWGALIVLVFLILSEQLIYYSTEAKQYSSDVLMALLLLFAFSGYLVHARRSMLWLAAAGVLGMWLSHPSVFVLAAIGLSISLDIIIKKEWGRLWQVGLVFLTWLVSFGILYFISYRFLTSSSILTGFFARDFMPVPPWTDLHWFRLAWIGLIHSRIGLPEGIITNIASFVVLAGCVSICLRKWQWGLVLIMPFVFTLIASGLEKYPFTGRLLLFLFPSVFFLIAEGLERIRLLLSKLNPWLAYAACAVLVLVFLYHEGTQAYKIARHPDMHDDIKPALSYLSQNKRNRDLIYIYHGAQPAFNYYAPFYNFSGKYFEMGIDARGAPAKYIQDINNLIGQGRVWFIFSHVPVSQDKNTNERLIFLDYLNQIGKQKRSFTSKQKDVYLYLYDLSVKKP